MANNDSDMPVSFPVTSWGCIQVVRDRAHPQHAPTVNRFITLYWRPVFYFLRVKGVTFQDAQDLCQDFFAWFLQKDKADKADVERGRFRDYLRTLVRNYLVDHKGKRAGAQVRFETRFVSVHNLLGDEERTWEPAEHDTPDAVFDRHWANGLWKTVMEQLKSLCADEHREKWFTIFLSYFAPENKRPSQEILAAKHQLSRDQVRDILAKTEKRFERLLRAELREEGAPEEELDQEIANMRNLLAKLSRS